MSNKVLTILPQEVVPHGTKRVPVIGERALTLVDSLHISEESKESVLSEACDILSHCVFPDEQGSRTNIAVGYVQSGKTMSFTVLSALAADNNFKVIIYLTGTKTNLQTQTFKRLKNDLKLGDNYLKYRIFDDNLENRQDEINRIKNFLQIDGCVLLFPILKHYLHIGTLADIFSSTSLRNIVANKAVLIVDDEADQSSFNTYARKNSTKEDWEEDDFSSTYSAILKLRKAFPCHSYIQYTATPQAAFLIDGNDILSPEYHTVLTPGDGYTGGQFFFENPEMSLINVIPEAEVYHRDRNPLTVMPKSLKTALQEFMVSVCVKVFIKKTEKYLSMMIHPDGYCDSNELFCKWVSSAIQNWIEIINSPENDPAREILISEFRKSYDLITLYVDDRPDFEEVVKLLPLAMMLNHIHLVQSRQSSSSFQLSNEINWDEDTSHILVGADMLNRGFTIEHLSMTYMPRTTKGKSNADTIEQRCRFFGYKRAYSDICRIFVSEKSKKEYEDYVKHEEILRANLKQCENMAEFSKMTKTMILSNRLNPTRSNILSKKIVSGKLSGWRSLLSLDCYSENSALVSSVLSKYADDDYEYFEKYGTNPQRNHRYLRFDVDSFIEQYFKQFRYQDVPNITRKIATIQYLNFLKENGKINYVYLIEMAYSAKGDQMRTRRIRAGRPINLMVGHSPDYSYPGDSEFKFEDSICFQLHHFRVNDPGMMGNKEMYNMTVYYPEQLETAYISLDDNEDADESEE